MDTKLDEDGTRDVLVSEFIPQAEEAFSKAGHRELWGVEFPLEQENWTAVHRGVLYKFVSAKPTLDEAVAQLFNTLKWRKEFRPLDAAFKENHSDVFEPLGVITPTPEGRVVTWNPYGAVTDPGTVFSDLGAFLRWRVGLMERGLAQLDFSDPQRDTMDQVHDYMDVSFLRMNPAARKGSQTTIKLFQDYYPELLRAKYFVNVPLFMMWVFKFARMTKDAKTANKFHVVHNGKDLAAILGKWVPTTYGGNEKSLQEQSIPKDASKPKVIPEASDTKTTPTEKEAASQPLAAPTTGDGEPAAAKSTATEAVGQAKPQETAPEAAPTEATAEKAASEQAASNEAVEQVIAPQETTSGPAVPQGAAAEASASKEVEPSVATGTVGGKLETTRV